MSSRDGKQDLDRALDVLLRHVPSWLGRVIGWVRHPRSRWWRIPLGLLFIASSVVWFLPVVGIEFLPLGLLLIAQDVPFLRGPVGRATLWLEFKAFRLLRWWQGRRRSSGTRSVDRRISANAVCTPLRGAMRRTNPAPAGGASPAPTSGAGTPQRQ